MSADALLDRLEALAVSNGLTTHFQVPCSLCLGPPDAKHMSGGACVAAAVFALENTIERPLIQLSAQFVSAIGNQVEATLEVEVTKQGRSITQASTAIQSEGSEAVRLFATLGERDNMHDRQWAKAGRVPEPSECPPMAFIRSDEGDLHTHLEFRQVPQNDQTTFGSFAFWVRSPSRASQSVTAPFLALIADYLPEAVHGSIEMPAGAVSLDNQIRIVSRDLGEWTLCQTRLEAVSNGVCHGRMRLSNEGGELLALAEQSCVVIPIQSAVPSATPTPS